MSHGREPARTRLLGSWGGELEDLAYRLGPDLILLALFSTLLATLMIAYGGSPSMLHGSTVMPMVAMVILVSAPLARRLPAVLRGEVGARRELARAAWTTVRDWFPLVLIIGVYENFHDLTRLIHPHTVDAALLRADQILFGLEPTRALERITVPWLTEYMTIAYALFFVYPTVLLLRLHLRGELHRFRELGLALSLCFYLGLVGYLLVPAIGPRYTVTYDVPLTGYFLTDAAARTWRLIENIQTDCFPSLHTAISTISLVYLWRLRAWRGGRALLWLCTPLIVSLIASTVYLRYHYAVDVLAGFVLAAVCCVAAPAITGAYYRRKQAHALDVPPDAEAEAVVNPLAKAG